MEESQKSRLRTYAWSYFAYHADQRMKTFHFYLLLVTAIVAGFLAALSRIDDSNLPYLSILGLLLFFVSLMFALLDRRNRELVRNGEAALKHLDALEGLPSDSDVPHILQIIDHDDYTTSRKRGFWPSQRHIGYSSVLGSIFFLFGTLGVVSAVFCLVYQG